ncbi:MAG: WbuC family cupin fold metalloprotein [Methyloversatilis sp.]|uniref:WbuC family cupin fold metalloprotein n=1 Tax=Methyloversatilis sp. TaxID=2569862 RepID=UPI0027335129|nr:WbuC family cupin fold metalloprotein [Methyloversatilis sp.]MDP2869202.1 WbuC family cupin fold metalloprotein [Methyloversatilis sp.]MDP3287531.1 WbuC family cupin fold metalloprotein [Methyloversatilis sp.]MDP3457229.1 WbuC family cupin fold metalloprotein [Methyloversatilis sp.]MDP3576621.1 WbuC family cupin fold metalloprotein [Methyloversatilis sp.]
MPARTRLIDLAAFDALTARAQASSRRRMNDNLHPHDGHPVHRLLNAIEPDSYVPPHRHLDPVKDETILCLRGRFGCILFDAVGTVQSLHLLGAGHACGIDIGHGQYHSLVSLEPGSVMFEAKSGPYLPLMTAELAPWAPGAGDPAAGAYLRWMAGLFTALQAG